MWQSGTVGFTIKYRIFTTSTVWIHHKLCYFMWGWGGQILVLNTTCEQQIYIFNKTIFGHKIKHNLMNLTLLSCCRRRNSNNITVVYMLTSDRWTRKHCSINFTSTSSAREKTVLWRIFEADSALTVAETLDLKSVRWQL